MKVLIICTEKLPVPPVRGGAIQTYIAGAVPTLSKKHSITILGRTDPDLPNEETIDNIHYVRTEGGLLETYRKGVINYLKSNPSFDLIHIFNRPRLVNPVRDSTPNARIVLSMHNDMFQPQKIDQEEGALAIEQVDKIITISNYIGHAITNFFPQAAPKLRTIYSGVDLNRFVPSYSDKARPIRQSIRNEYQLQNKKVILFAGRLSANKGADVLVRAIPEVAKKHPDAALVLMGGKWFSDDGVTDYIAYVRALAQRSQVPIITTGFVAPDKIQEWFAAADVFVCPSQWQEPLARVHYEAMAAGLPIVTTDRGGNTEVIDLNKNGLIVENPEDPSEFAKHITNLLSNPSICKEMGQYGRKIAEQKYNWSRVVSDIENVWNEIEYNIQNNIEIGSQEVVETTMESEQFDVIEQVNEEVRPEVVVPLETQEDVLPQQSITEEHQNVVDVTERKRRRKRNRNRNRSKVRRKQNSSSGQILVSFSGQRKYFTSGELKRQNIR
ncbi:glycosyltransferase family 4 protein [Bacillus sp. FJAT-45350]|uniref:glycosyltransferase family 4 protein n=1 Tax=Bacillus sp. FJAT-45350 TaxID=2011014 RepID=UPI000BB683CD|nr:glycosyltransferase family 4 protein [Bacillus sp. FJAT-45350]